MRARFNLLSSRTRGLLLVGGTAVLWGTSGLTATVAYDRGVEPLTVSFWRMALGAVLLLPLLRGSGAPARAHRPLQRGGLLLRLTGVAAGLAGYQAGYFLAVQRAGISIATLVTLGLAPVLVTVLERVGSRERTSRATLGGVALAVAGLALLVGLPADRAAGVVAGVGFAATSAVGYAGLTFAGGSLSARLGAPRLTALAFVGSTLLLLPVAGLAAGLSLSRDPVVLGAMLYLGVVPTALAYRWFFAGLEHLPASVASILALLEPVVATALAVPLRGERLSAVGWVGAAVLVAAVALVSATSTRATTSPG